MLLTSAAAVLPVGAALLGPVLPDAAAAAVAAVPAAASREDTGELTAAEIRCPASLSERDAARARAAYGTSDVIELQKLPKRRVPARPNGVGRPFCCGDCRAACKFSGPSQ